MMFDLPSREDIVKAIITAETVLRETPPKLVLSDGTVIQEDKKTSA